MVPMTTMTPCTPTRDGHIAGDRAGLAQETALDRDRCLARDFHC